MLELKPSHNQNLSPFITELQARTNQKLRYFLPESNLPPLRLHEAMRYAVLSNGKRIRPLFVYATGMAFGSELDSLDKPACAVELIHAYSLIHDDLPAMDDDDLRRGHPTCHRAFDEATAILAGDALQSFAFQLLASNEQFHLGPSQLLKMIRLLTEAIGTSGMAGGQAMDLNATGAQLSPQNIELMHQRKTGALIQVSIHLGAIASGCEDTFILKQLGNFGNYIGLAFQIQDDVLDIESTTAVLGKTQGADANLNKATYPQVVGIDEAKRKVHLLYQQAIDCLDQTALPADDLRNLAKYIVVREY